MDIDVLKSLVAVAETGSFSRAATVLCVSQSAVSKRVKLLEDNLGLLLLDRSGPVLQLTEAGDIVTRSAREIVDICCRCTEKLRRFKQEKRLSFGCTPSFGLSSLPKVVRTFMKQRPDVTSFSFSFDDPERIMEGLQTGLFHLAVIEHCDFLPLQTEELGRLSDDIMLLVGAPCLGLPPSLEDVGTLFPINMCVRSSGCCSRSILESKITAFGRTLDDFNKVLVYDDLNMIIQAVLAGDGIAYIARDVVAGYLAEGKMVSYVLPGFDQVYHRSLLVGPGFVSSPESDELIKIIQDLC